jgi:hypothetical protein
MTAHEDGSITRWIGDLKAGGDSARAYEARLLISSLDSHSTGFA